MINNEMDRERNRGRGQVVMPIMIGLSSAPSTGDQGKSRPAVFSASKAKKMNTGGEWFRFPRQMNDLVITMKDPRTVRVFGENTQSGKLIEKNKMTDMVNCT